jgi:hypothetical protein
MAFLSHCELPCHFLHDKTATFCHPPRTVFHYSLVSNLLPGVALLFCGTLMHTKHPVKCCKNDWFDSFILLPFAFYLTPDIWCKNLRLLKVWTPAVECKWKIILWGTKYFCTQGELLWRNYFNCTYIMLDGISIVEARSVKLIWLWYCFDAYVIKYILLLMILQLLITNLIISNNFIFYLTVNRNCVLFQIWVFKFIC